MQQWKDGGADVLAVQIASGGAGVDLTRARYCVYLSTGFNLGNYVQSLARCHRPGQTKPVSYYHILARGSIDETVHHALRHKQNVVDAILATLTP
jgi:SNF2 family DNA or RNA helicase